MEQKIDIGKAVEFAAREKAKHHQWLTAISMLPYVILGGFVVVIAILMDKMFPNLADLKHPPTSIPTSIILLAFFMFMIIGSAASMVNIVWEKGSLDVLDVGKWSLRGILSCIYLAPLHWIALIVCASFELINTVFLLFIRTYFAWRFSLFAFFMIDKKMGLFSALKQSYRSVSSQEAKKLYEIRGTSFALAHVYRQLVPKEDL